jgi:hypothetical protein
MTGRVIGLLGFPRLVPVATLKGTTKPAEKIQGRPDQVASELNALARTVYGRGGEQATKSTTLIPTSPRGGGR